MGEMIEAVSSGGGVDDGELLCPRCGYDLRGSFGGRCSECGQEIDRATLAVSGFPWVHCKTAGSLLSYLKTVWLVTIGSRHLRYETAKPQGLRDARRCAWVTATIVAGLFLGIFATWTIQSKGLSFMVVHPPQMYSRQQPQWSDDLLVPWSAGATMWP